MYVCVYVCIYVLQYIRTYIYIHIHIPGIYIYIYIYIIYIYLEIPDPDPCPPKRITVDPMTTAPCPLRTPHGAVQSKLHEVQEGAIQLHTSFL